MPPWTSTKPRGSTCSTFSPPPSHHKNGLLEKQAILPAVLAGLAAAGLAAWVSNGLDTGLLRKLFGLFLLYVGLTQLLRRDKPADDSVKKRTTR